MPQPGFADSAATSLRVGQVASMSSQFFVLFALLLLGCSARTPTNGGRGGELQNPPYVGLALFTPNSKFVIAETGGAGSVQPYKMWEVATGTVVPTGHGLYPSTLHFLPPDGSSAFSNRSPRSSLTAFGPEFALLEVPSGKVIRQFSCDSDGARFIVASIDGKRAFTGHGDALCIWDVETGKTLRKLQAPGLGGSGSIQSPILLAPDGTFAVSETWSNNSHVWDMESGRWLRRLEGYNSEHKLFALSPDGKLVLGGRTRGSVEDMHALTLWETSTGKILRTLVGHKRAPLASVFTPDGRSVLSCGEEGTIKRWEVSSGKQVWSVQADDAPFGLKSAAFSPNGEWGVTGHMGRKAKLWDAVNGRWVRDIQ